MTRELELGIYTVTKVMEFFQRIGEKSIPIPNIKSLESFRESKDVLQFWSELPDENKVELVAFILQQSASYRPTKTVL